MTWKVQCLENKSLKHIPFVNVLVAELILLMEIITTVFSNILVRSLKSLLNQSLRRNFSLIGLDP